jgi:hypothetical protein
MSVSKAVLIASSIDFNTPGAVEATGVVGKLNFGEHFPIGYSKVDLGLIHTLLELYISIGLI